MCGLLLGSCSLNKLAMNKVAGMLSTPAANDVFMSDNDPELVGDAMPFAIKFYEALLASMPEHEGLRLRTGSLYIMYANAFLQTPADMTPQREPETKEHLLARAKNLYLRGRDMLIVALEQKNPALRRQLKERRYKDATAPFQSEDIPFLYWTAAGWIGAFAIDPFDMKFALTLPQAAALMGRAEELDPNYGRGAVDNFYILYYGSLPDYMGGDTEKARRHFNQAIALSGGTDTSPYLALAQTVCVKQQDVEGFKTLLHQVLELDPDRHPETRLINILNQRKARWLLAHIDEYFLLEKPEDGSQAQEDI